MSNDAIPFLDLVTVHRELEDELVEVTRRALRSAAFIGGAEVEGLEQEFAAYCEVPHCVGVSSGTDALRFAIMAAGIQPGDTVITVPNTFIATTEAITQAGAHFDFVDVDDRTYTLDPEKLRAYLADACVRDSDTGVLRHKRTGRPVTGVIPVHLYGQMANMDPILAIARDHNLIVIEDACQAHGAEYYSSQTQRWHKAGSMGKAAAFSFYPGKNLGACGEAGAITTSDERIAARCRMLREHGQSKKYFHDVEGYNGRLDALQAGFLRVKLRRLAEWNRQRQEAAQTYSKLFGQVEGIVLPHVPTWSRPVHHLYVIRVSNREALQARLSKVGIGSGIHYPIPLHVSPAYSTQQFDRDGFPVTERAAAAILSLPMFPGLSVESQRRVVAEVLQFVTESAASERTPEVQSA